MAQSKLNQAQVTAALPQLIDHMTGAQIKALQQLLPLISAPAQTINLQQAFDTLYPGVDVQDALGRFRQLRLAANKAMPDLLNLCVDSSKRSSPNKRHCWFEGADVSLQSLRVQQSTLLNSNAEYQAKDYQPSRASSLDANEPIYRIFISSSCNGPGDHHIEEKKLIAEFIGLLKNAFRSHNRGDLVSSIWHFEDHPDNAMEPRIMQVIAQCDAGVLLMSYGFLASKFCKTKELPNFWPHRFEAKEPGSKYGMMVMLDAAVANCDVGEIKKRIGDNHPTHDFQYRKYSNETQMHFKACNSDERKAFVDQLAADLIKRLPLLPDGDRRGQRHDTQKKSYITDPKHVLTNDSQLVKARNASQYLEHDYHPNHATGIDLQREGTKSLNTLNDNDKNELAHLVADASTPPSDHSQGFVLIDHLLAWAKDSEGANVYALLGELGMGKTFNCRMFAKRLLDNAQSTDHAQQTAMPIPLYIDLRDIVRERIDAVPSLEFMCEQWLDKVMDLKGQVSFDNLRALVQQQQALLILDGFDEVSVHLPNNGDLHLLKECLRILHTLPNGKVIGKLLITCRTHYFPSIAQQNALLTDAARGTTRVVLEDDHHGIGPSVTGSTLLPFDEASILSYLCQTLGDEQGRDALTMIGSIHDLKSLASQPYLLRLIRAQIAQLEQLKAQGGVINAARVYGLFIDDWLQRDEGKHTINPEDKKQLMQALAAQLWAQPNRAWSYPILQDWVYTVIASKPGWSFRYQPKADLLAKDLHAATFIVRQANDDFSFMHSSMHEYFLAAHLLQGLVEQQFERWNNITPSQETLVFVGELWALLPKHLADKAHLGFQALCAAPPSPHAVGLALDYLQLAQLKLLPYTLPRSLNLTGFTRTDLTLAGTAQQPWHLHTLKLDQARLISLTMQHMSIQQLSWSGAWLNRALSINTHVQTLVDSLPPAAAMGMTWVGGQLGSTVVQQVFAEHPQHFLGSRFDTCQSTAALAQGILKPNAHTGPWWNTPESTVGGQNKAVLTLFSQSEVNSVALSVDGKSIVSGGDDGRVLLWDTQSGALKQEMGAGEKAHEGVVFSISLSADGKSIVSGGTDGRVLLWDTQSGALKQVMGAGEKAHQDWVRSVALSADGKSIVSGGDDGRVLLWDTQSGALKQVMGAGEKAHQDWVRSVALSADGKSIVSGGDDGRVLLWDTQSGALKQTMGAGEKAHEGVVFSISLSADGKSIVSGGTDGRVLLWDADSGALKQAMGAGEMAHQDWVTSVSLSVDGKSIVSGGDDGRVLLWDADSGALKQAMGVGEKAHKGVVNSVSLSADGKSIVSGGIGGWVLLWDADSGALKQAMGAVEKAHEGLVRSVSLSADGKSIVSGGIGGWVLLWDAQSGELKQVMGAGQKAHEGLVFSVALSVDGKSIVSGGRDGRLLLWDVQSGALKQEMGSAQKAHDGVVFSVALSADGKSIVSGAGDGRVLLWDAQSGALKQAMGAGEKVHEDLVRSVALSADGKSIVSGGDGRLLLWDAQSGALKQEMVVGERGQRDMVLSVAVSADGKSIVSGGGKDGRVLIWDADSGALKQEMGAPQKAHEDWVLSVAMSADGKGIVSGGRDGRVLLWDADSGVLKQAMGAGEKAHEDLVLSVALSEDGKSIVSGGLDGRVMLWNADNGALMQEMGAGQKAHESWVRSVALSVDGGSVLSNSGASIMLHKAATGQCQAQWQAGTHGGVSFTSDGELRWADASLSPSVWRRQADGSLLPFPVAQLPDAHLSRAFA